MSDLAWLNPKLLRFTTDNHYRLMSSTSPELVASGPTRTSKTLQCLIKMFSLAFKYRGFKARIVRLTDTDLTDTVRADIRNDLFCFPLSDNRCPVKIAKGGPTEFTHLVVPSTGAEIILGGMKRPRNVLGSHADMIFYSQADESTEEQHQMLKTRVVGTAANWWPDTSDRPRFQFLMDCNPDAPDHYLKVREGDGLLEMIDFNFEDNPLLFPDGKNASPVGETVVDELDRSLVGIYHDRYFKGLWVSPRGRVFDLKPCHVVDDFPSDFPGNWWHTNMMDFGMTDPNVCVWASEHVKTQDVFVWKDFRRTHTDIIRFGQMLVPHRSSHRISNTIIDNDEEKQIILRRDCGISTEMARKGPGSIVDGINLIQNALNNREMGEPGGLFFYSGMRVDSDPELVRLKKPLDTLQEFRLLHYPGEDTSAYRVGKDLLPVDKHNHGVDAVRYRFLWRAGMRRPLGFRTSGARRKGYI